MLELPISGIKKIEEMAKADPGCISLALGSLELGGIPQQIKQHVQDLMTSTTTDYYDSSWGVFAFRQKIVDVLFKQYGLQVPVSRVLATHGCMGALANVYLSVLEPGDEVIIPEPCYPPYAMLARVARSVPVFVSMINHSGGNDLWDMDLEKIKAAVTPRTKIVIFSNPCNPLGVVVSLAKIDELAAWCDQRGIYLIIDEAYREYAFSDVYQSALSLLNTRSHLICVSTFSKNMAMSGWRVGYIVAPEPLAKIMSGVQNAIFNCLNNVSQYAAMYSLDHPEFVDVFRARIQLLRDKVLYELQPLKDRGLITYQKPDGGFFLFVKTNQADATEMCMNILQNAKVAVVPGKPFGPSGNPYFRICFARQEPLLLEGIARLKSFFM